MIESIVERIETFVVEIPRDTPYLGALGPGEQVNEKGYFVRTGNQTIYPAIDRSLVVRLTASDGRVGWGETYGLVAPAAPIALIDDVIAPFVIGSSPFDAAALWDKLYDLMRVRGYQGGFWLDAIAAVDIALWDLAAQIAGQPLHRMIGGCRRKKIPAYVSGLPRATLPERIDLARSFQARGFNAFKIAAVMTPGGVEAEIRALREALGPEAALMVDHHWMMSPPDAVALIRRLEPHRIAFAEAPCAPEDIAGMAHIAANTATSIAGGEEWRTVFDARARLDARAVSIVQPEMGHTGITQFMRIASLAAAHHVSVIPHATIGCGIFLAASLQASAAIGSLPWHEYQHSIFDRTASLLEPALVCEAGHYVVPAGVGLGIAPGAAFWDHVAPRRVAATAEA